MIHLKNGKQQILTTKNFEISTPIFKNKNVSYRKNGPSKRDPSSILEKKKLTSHFRQCDTLQIFLI